MIDRHHPPTRLELFTFYFLGFNPAGEYKFPNVRHVAKFYNVQHDDVFEWLKELDLQPSKILRKHYHLAGAQVDLQLEAKNLTPEGIQSFAADVLKEVDGAKTGRKAEEGEFGDA